MIYMAVRLIPADDDYPADLEMVDEGSLANTEERCKELVKQLEAWSPEWAKRCPVTRIGQFRAVELFREEDSDD